MNTPLFIFGILCALLGLWMLWGWLSVRNIEQPRFKVIRSTKLYEIREYREQLIAKTTVKGGMNTALKQGFRRIAAFIFGANKTQESVAMTAPVTSQGGGKSTAIAMTAPVTSKAQNGSYTIGFIMPSKYTLKTLPKPLDKKIVIEKIPAKTYAVLTFSGYATEKRSAEKIKTLQKALKTAKMSPKNDPILSQYNPPWTPWFMRRNEIWIELKKKSI